MRDLRLLTKGILMSFAEMVYYNQRRAYKLWLVTPWVSSLEEGVDALCLLIDSLRGRNCDVILITRPPKHDWHTRSEELLETQLNAVVYHCSSLHTKLYILECDGFRGAVLGSPNLTPRANTFNREIAVEFRTGALSDEDDIGNIINELICYTSALRGENDVTLKTVK